MVGGRGRSLTPLTETGPRPPADAPPLLFSQLLARVFAAAEAHYSGRGASGGEGAVATDVDWAAAWDVLQAAAADGGVEGEGAVAARKLRELAAQHEELAAREAALSVALRAAKASTAAAEARAGLARHTAAGQLLAAARCCAAQRCDHVTQRRLE